MFGNNGLREFAISLPKQPQCKSEQMSLSLFKTWIVAITSLSSFSVDCRYFNFWEDCCQFSWPCSLSLQPLGRPLICTCITITALWRGFFFFFFNFLAHGLHIHLVVVIFIQMYSPKEFFNNKDRDSIPWHDSVGLSYKISRKESFS